MKFMCPVIPIWVCLMAIFICSKWFFRARGMKNAQAKADILRTSHAGVVHRLASVKITFSSK